MSDADYARDRASQIHLGMEFDGAFLFPKRGPRKKGQAEVDRGGIQSVSRLGDLQSEVLACIELSGRLDQHMSEVRVDTPIPFFVGIGQRASRNFASEPCMIEPGLVETRKVSSSILALVPANAFVEFVSREKAHELRKNDSP